MAMENSSGNRGKIGFATALAMGVGGMIGVAIFAFPGTTAMLAGDLAPLAWLAAGLMIMLVGLVYSELATRYPLSGGPAHYPRLVLQEVGHPGLGRFLSYLEGVGFTLGWTIAVVISAIILPEYASYVIGPVNSGLLAALSVLSVVGINIIGLRPAGRLNLVLTAVLVTLILLLAADLMSNSQRTPLQRLSSSINLGGFLAATGIAAGAYGAWVSITAVAGEVENPRIVSKSVIASILIVAVVYTSLVYSLHMVLDPGEASRSEVMWAPVAYAASQIGSDLTQLVAWGAIVAIFTTMIVGVASVARVIKAMGDSGILPSLAAWEHRGEPLGGLLLVALISIPLSLMPHLFFKLMVVGLLIGTIVPYSINVLSYIALKIKDKNQANPSGDTHANDAGYYRAPGGIITGIASLAVLAVVGINLGKHELIWSTIALLLVILPYLAWYYYKGEQ